VGHCWFLSRLLLPNEERGYGRRHTIRFALGFVFLIAGYTGSASLLSRLPFFALLAAFSAFCGLIASFKANFFDVETREHYWISGCKKYGSDALYSTRVEMDDDVRDEYWITIRKQPELRGTSSFRCAGKYSK